MTEHDAEAREGRETAPMSEYSQRDVGIGFAVLIAGALVAFGVPLAVTL